MGDASANFPVGSGGMVMGDASANFPVGSGGMVMGDASANFPVGSGGIVMGDASANFPVGSGGIVMGLVEAKTVEAVAKAVAMKAKRTFIVIEVIAALLPWFETLYRIVP